MSIYLPWEPERGPVTRAETAEKKAQTTAQEATALARELLKAEQAWRSEKALRGLIQKERDEAHDRTYSVEVERDAALERCAELEDARRARLPAKTYEVVEAPESFKAYAGSDPD